MSLGPGSGSGSGSETRKKGYKTAIVAEEGRRRREEDLIGIRKNKRRDALLNKRRVTHAVPSYDTVPIYIFNHYFLLFSSYTLTFQSCLAFGIGSYSRDVTTSMFSVP